MFREIRGIEDKSILCAIHRLPSFYFKGGWTDEICIDFFSLPVCGEEAVRITIQADKCQIGFREKIHLFRALGICGKTREGQILIIVKKCISPRSAS